MESRPITFVVNFVNFFLYRKGREWNFLHPQMEAQRTACPDACWKREGIR